MENTATMTKLDYINFYTLARCSIVIASSLLLLSVGKLNLFLVATVVFCFCADRWRSQAHLLFKNQVVLISLLFITFISIAVFYSQASWFHSYRVWDKYLKIAYFIFFMPLLFEPSWRKRMINFLILGAVISEICVYLHFFNLFSFSIPHSKHWLFVQDIDASYIIAYICFLLINLAINENKYQWLYAMLFVFFSYDLLFMNQERTGYLIFISLMSLFLLQRWGWKGLLSAIVMVPLLVGGLYISSSNFHQRINQVFSNIQDYHHGNNGTSIGLRLAFAEYSFEIIKQHPILGAGTGSFEELYQKMNGPKLDDQTWPAHPHNEYILVTLQWGLVGLLLFLIWIAVQIREMTYLPQFEKYLMQGSFVAFLVLGFCNTSLFVNPAGIFYILLLSLCMASKPIHSLNKFSQNDDKVR